MQINFISFLDYQKKNTLKVKSQPKVYLTNKLPFNYIRAENLITNLYIDSSLKQINFYFDLLHFRNMENRSPVSQVRPHLDRFSLYLSIQLGFKSVTNFSAITVFQPREELNFFSYYNKPFSSKSTIVLIKSVTQKFSVTKYTRIDYQRKLQIIRRSTFLSQSQGYISFFSYIFSKNNFKKYTAISKKAKKRKFFGIRMLPSKLKLRSIKDETTKSPHIAILFAKTLFRNKKISQFSAKKVNSLFPRKVQYRFTKRAQNKLKFQRKRKNKKVHRVKKRNYFIEKGKSYRKPRNF
jgi:hypothetical protein